MKRVMKVRLEGWVRFMDMSEIEKEKVRLNGYECPVCKRKDYAYHGSEPCQECYEQLVKE